MLMEQTLKYLAEQDRYDAAIYHTRRHAAKLNLSQDEMILNIIKVLTKQRDDYIETIKTHFETCPNPRIMVGTEL